MAQNEIRIDRQCGFVLQFGLVEFSCQEQGGAQIVVESGIVRLQLDRPLVRFPGFGDSLLKRQQITDVVIRTGIADRARALGGDLA